jgi:hypothetical protein
MMDSFQMTVRRAKRLPLADLIAIGRADFKGATIALSPNHGSFEDMSSFLRPAALTLALTLAACTTWEPKIAPLENYQPESFGANAYARHYAASPARTCEAARRALLSQGYVVIGAAGEQVSGRKYFQPDAYHHVQLEFRVVCAPERGDDHASMAFVSGLKEQYLVRKAKDSASLGVGGIGSLSVPIEGNLDSMVKVSSETVTDPQLYERLFALLGEQRRDVCALRRESAVAPC